MKKRYIFVIGPAILLVWASCKPKQKENAAPPATPVNIYEAAKGNAVYYDQYQGTVVSLNIVELRSQVSGYVTGITFKEGELVTKGQQLYEIDRRKYLAAYQQAQAAVSSAQASLNRAQKDVDRYNMLLKQDAVARQLVDNAVATLETSRSQVASARAALSSARTDLSFSIIRAPFTGRIGISQVRLGAQVTPGTTLLNTISAEDPMGVDFVINEQDINRFYKLENNSTDSTFKLQMSDGQPLNRPGRILAIDRGINNQTGTIKVRVKFSNADKRLKDGMSTVVKVLNEQSGQRVIIPYKSITEQMGEFFVFVAKDTIAEQVKVKVGPRLGEQVVIMEGVAAGDKVITEGFQRLRDGGKITLGAPAQPQGAGGPQGQGTQPAKK
jgi:RND family efflux transporter MFP subunit